MRKFAVVKRFNENEIELPERKTAHSAGYDFEVAEDIVIPAYKNIMRDFDGIVWRGGFDPLTLEEVAEITKKYKFKPTLVPTGVKVYLEDDEYLELSVRSSCPLKHWIILANGVGIIDQDYADNIDNDGEIYFQVINLSSFDIQLKKGDIIGQGIIKKYLTTDDDKANGKRTGGFGSTSEQKQTKKYRTQTNIIDESNCYSANDVLSTLAKSWQNFDSCDTDYDRVYSSVNPQDLTYVTSSSNQLYTINDTVSTLANAVANTSFSAEEMGNALQKLSLRLKEIQDNE